MPYKNREAKLAWKERNKDKLKAQAKALRILYPERHKNTNLKSLYGVTLDEYNQMFEKQKGCCLLCSRHQVEVTQRLNLDHCHTTGRVRGLLCGNCNRGIGLLKHNVVTLENAVRYLREA